MHKYLIVIAFGRPFWFGGGYTRTFHDGRWKYSACSYEQIRRNTTRSFYVNNFKEISR